MTRPGFIAAGLLSGAAIALTLAALPASAQGGGSQRPTYPDQANPAASAAMEGIWKIANPTDELKPVSGMEVNKEGIIFGVRDHSPAFLQYLEKMNLTIGKKIKIAEVNTYDHSVTLLTGGKKLHISREVANNLLIAL